jgi:tetratricopeptide (TPR) repeat protein
MPLRTTTQSPGLCWHGSFFVHHSLALVNRELTLALLDRGGIEIGVRDYERPVFGAEADPRFGRLMQRLEAHPSAPAVTVRHLWPPDFSRPDTPRFVLIQPWEFGSLPVSWVKGITRSVDECWVPSEYVREVYESSGVPAEKVFVVPNGVNTTRFNPDAPAYDLPTKKGFKFLFVGGTIGRKGIDLLLQAYGRTFTDRDDVTLIIKDFGRGSFYAGQDAAALIAAHQARPGAPEIVHLTEDLTEAEVAGLYTACDALAHPYRGEGYGLPIAEAMACGKPTIVTAAGAAMDFADATTSYLVPASRLTLNERRIGELETVDFPWWYEPDTEALGATLRRAFDNSAQGRLLGEAAAKRIAERHTWAHAAEIAGARFAALAEDNKRTTAARRVGIEPISFENRKQSVLGLTREGKWAEAIVEAEACLAARPTDDDLLNALAVSRFRNGEREKAIDLLRAEVERSPESRDFRHNLSFMLLGEGRSTLPFAEVSEALDHAIGAAELTRAIRVENGDLPQEVQRTLERARDVAQKCARRIRKSSGKEDVQFRTLSVRIALANDLLSGSGADTAQGPEAAAPFQPARISVVMIARNEEQFLEDCLRSVQGVVDEIVLVDTGSTDRTMEIARRFGAKVVEYPWNDDFSAARNVSLEHATGDWALWLDADERLAASEGDLLRYLANAAEPNVGGYMVNIRNYMSRAEHAEVCWHRACRLFRLDTRIRFSGRIHEQNMRPLQDAGYVCALSQLTLDHYGYAADVMNERGKHERFIRMLTREVEENPDDAYRTFHLFNLGNAYYTHGDMPNAAKWLSRAAEGADPEEEYTALLFVEWATALYAMSDGVEPGGRAREALQVCKRAEELGVDHPGIDFARGHSYLHLQDYTSAERAFRSCFERGRTGVFVHSGDAGAYTYKAKYGLALALTGQERHEESVEQCQLALDEKDGSPRFADGRYLLGNGLRRLNRLDKARRAFEELLAIAPAHVLGLVDYGCVLHELGDLPAALSALRRASTIQPGSLEVWTRLGSCAEQLGLPEEWVEALMIARRIAPRSAEVLVNLGRAFAAKGEQDRALDCFTDAMRADPRYGNAYFNAGDLLYQLGYYPKAAEAYCAGLEVDPDNAPGYFVLGNCLAKLGALPAAREAYAHAAAARPDYEEAIQNLQVVDELIAERAA